MKCPHCSAEIEQVNVFSQCWQKGEVDKDGKITEFGSVEDILETLGIECRECFGDLTGIVNE